MEDSGSVRARNTTHENRDPSRKELLSTKPLHRFVQRDPKSVGVVVLMFGCAELLVGFVKAGDGFRPYKSFTHAYTPFWQGALFIVCGILSIYTGTHPSKKMVTVCLSMYVVSLLGIIVSFGFRITFMIFLELTHYFYSEIEWLPITAQLLTVLEILLFLSSICVSGLLIFLCVIARLSLKSTRTHIVLHQIQPPETETPAEAN